MINIAVCDDSAHSSDIVGALYELAEGRAEVAVDAFKTAVTLKNEIKNKRYDIFLLDPDVADAEGLSLAREIKCLFPECDIILMNSSGKYAVEGYSVFAIGYILKPASQKDIRAPFLHALDKYRKKPAVVFKDKNGARVAVSIAELLYIEVIGTELHIHKRTGVTKCQGSLTEACQNLPAAQFYRSHRSYVVNMDYVIRAVKYHFVMDNGDKVTIAKNRYAEAKEKLHDFVG